MNVLSLFDGQSCGRLALEMANINVSKYYSSEIEKHPIIVASNNYPQDNPYRLGDVREVKGKDLDKIQLLIGGSPCTNFSFAGKRNGMSTNEKLEITTLKQYLKLKKDGMEFEGQSYLFWEYVRLMKETKPKYFLLENVLMDKKWENIISKTLGVKPILINSSLTSAQYRPRLYWTNINVNSELKDEKILIKDILEENSSLKVKTMTLDNLEMNSSGNGIINIAKGTTGKSWFFEQQLYDLNSKTRTLKAGGGSGNIPKIIIKVEGNTIYYRNMSPLECERLQNVKDNYTNSVPNCHRYKMLGNGWTIKVIAFILKHI